MSVDLHTHSTASDGTFSPAELVALAADQNLHAIAISDHDSVSGISQAIAQGAKSPITVIPAVEFSAIEDDLSIHILGFFIDHTDQALLDELSLLRAGRLVRAEHMVQMLAADGFTLDFNDMVKLIDGGSLGRSHIAASLVRSGYASSLSEAFKHFVGREAPYFVPKTPVSVHEIVNIIHWAGGLAVVAHPGISGVDGLIDSMIGWGIDGLEALHAEHTPAQRTFYEQIATRHNLLISGGSDYHGPHMAGRPLGAANVPDEILFKLADAAGQSVPASLRGRL